MYTYPENFRAYKALIAAEYSGVKVKVASDFEFGVTNTTEAFLKKFPTGQVCSESLIILIFFSIVFLLLLNYHRSYISCMFCEIEVIFELMTFHSVSAKINNCKDSLLLQRIQNKRNFIKLFCCLWRYSKIILFVSFSVCITHKLLSEKTFIFLRSVLFLLNIEKEKIINQLF